MPCSDIGLDVGLALGGSSEVGGPPVAALDGGEQGEEDLEVEAAESHPHGVEVPADDPGGGEEAA